MNSALFMNTPRTAPAHRANFGAASSASSPAGPSAASRAAGSTEPQAAFRAAGSAGSSAEQLHRRPRTRPAESALRRLVDGSADLFRGNDYPRRLAEAAAGTQRPVTTGRRIAVVGSRGGAGKTTVAALLARIYAVTRADAVAAIDNAPGTGTLGLRLGVPAAPSLDAVAARLGADAPVSLRQLAALLTVAEPANLLVTGRRGNPLRRASAPGQWAGVCSVSAGPPAAAWLPAGPGAPDDGVLRDDGVPAAGGVTGVASVPAAGGMPPDRAALLSRAISRCCPITILDCGPGLADPAARGALQNAHAAVFVTPASVAGLADAVEYAAAWRLDPGFAAVPFLMLIVQSTKDSAFSASREARELRRAGINALHLGPDRHLAAGVEVNPALLARRTRLEAVLVASHVLAAAVTGPVAENSGTLSTTALSIGHPGATGYPA